mmetsp:Transcript_16394/g.35615  ORF Transcript_16394/g.35615 Transcript_16394/m.35615 type:complete len:214 (+) Transcript_16394:759-1400(+)
MRTPTRTGTRATETAASGTAGTSRYFNAGTFLGSSTTTDEIADPPASAKPSTVLNQFLDAVAMALISGLYGPLSRSLIRSVGCRTSSPAAVFPPAGGLPVPDDAGDAGGDDSSESCRISHCCSLTLRAFLRLHLATRSGLLVSYVTRNSALEGYSSDSGADTTSSLLPPDKRESLPPDCDESANLNELRSRCLALGGPVDTAEPRIVRDTDDG